MLYGIVVPSSNRGTISCARMQVVARRCERCAVPLSEIHSLSDGPSVRTYLLPFSQTAKTRANLKQPKARIQCEGDLTAGYRTRRLLLHTEMVWIQRWPEKQPSCVEGND